MVLEVLVASNAPTRAVEKVKPLTKLIKGKIELTIDYH